MDISKESEATKKLYGIGEKPTDYFGRQCLIARRLVERGVRFIQLYSGGGHQQESWDAHYGLHENHSLHCAETDKPMAGLIEDLKARGLFDSTLVVGRRLGACRSRNRASGAITIRTASRCGWQAAA